MYTINNGEISYNVLYLVSGTESIVYNSITYALGQFFRGLPGIKSFTPTGIGTPSIVEVLEIRGLGIEYFEINDDQPVYNNSTIFTGFSLEYQLNEAEKKVSDVTQLKGFSLELIDYPFYSFTINETRV
jgi:hypothetical protein